MRSRKFLCALLFIAPMMLATQVHAGACPGSDTNSYLQYASRNGAGTATLAFVNSGSNCAFMLTGNAVTCDQSVSAARVFFIAGWANETARTADATGGCVFTCPGGSCTVRNDGLPVELMEFEISAKPKDSK